MGSIRAGSLTLRNRIPYKSVDIRGDRPLASTLAFTRSSDWYKQ